MSSPSRSLKQRLLLTMCLALASSRGIAQNNYLEYKSPDWYFLG